MISHDLAIRVDGDAWTRVATSLIATFGARPSAGRPVVIFLDRGRLLRAIEIGRGAVSVEWAGNVERIRKERGAPWVIAIERGAVSLALANWQRAHAPDQDFVLQGIALLRELRRTKGLWSSPTVWIPPHALVRLLFNWLIPDKNSALLGIGSDQLAIEKERGVITTLTTDPPAHPVHLHVRIDPTNANITLERGPFIARLLVYLVRRMVARMLQQNVR